MLWGKVKAWVKTTDQIEFAKLWVEISGDPSAPHVERSAFARAFVFVLFLSDYFVDYSLVLGSAYLAVYHTH